jgi:hypothetical protein
MEDAVRNGVIPARVQNSERAALALDIVARLMSIREFKVVARRSTEYALDLPTRGLGLGASTKNLSRQRNMSPPAANRYLLKLPTTVPDHNHIMASSRSMGHPTHRHRTPRNLTHHNTIPPIINQLPPSHNPKNITTIATMITTIRLQMMIIMEATHDRELARIFIQAQTTTRMITMTNTTMEPITSHQLYHGAKEAIIARRTQVNLTLSRAIHSNMRPRFLQVLYLGDT